MTTKIVPSWIMIRDKSITVGKDSIPWAHPRREDVLQAIREGRFEDIPDMISPAKAVSAFGKGKLTIDNGQVMYNNLPVHGLLNSRILDMIAMHLPVEPLLAFVDRVRSNPNTAVQIDLYGFLEYGQLPLTEDGCFLARKFTTADFKPPIQTSSNISWAPGENPKEPRADLDENPNNTCSRGLHAYSKEYAKQFWKPGYRMVVVKIDPKDVIAVPPDYNNTKIRFCECWVLTEITNEDDPEYFGSLVYSVPVYVSNDYVNDNDESDVTFCTNCGLEVGIHDEINFCPQCGNDAGCDDNYCGQCGQSFDDIDDNNYCAHCGNDLQ